MYIGNKRGSGANAIHSMSRPSRDMKQTAQTDTERVQHVAPKKVVVVGDDPMSIHVVTKKLLDIVCLSIGS